MMLSKYWPIIRGILSVMPCVAGGVEMCISFHIIVKTRSSFVPLSCQILSLVPCEGSRSIFTPTALVQTHRAITAASWIWSSQVRCPRATLYHFDLLYVIPLCRQTLWFPRTASRFLSLAFIIHRSQSHHALHPEITHPLWTGWQSSFSVLEREEEMAGIPSPEYSSSCLV